MRSELIVVLSVHVGNQVRYRVFKETVVYPKTFFLLVGTRKVLCGTF